MSKNWTFGHPDDIWTGFRVFLCVSGFQTITLFWSFLIKLQVFGDGPKYLGLRKKGRVFRAQSNKTFHTLGHIYKLVLKLDNMLRLRKYLVRILGHYTLKYL